MYMIKIPSHDVSELCNYAETILQAGGKLMRLVEGIKYDEMGMRDENYLYPEGREDMGMRDYQHMGMRDGSSTDMGERRSRNSRGRFI